MSNCIEAICKPQDLGQSTPDTIIAGSFARLKASADLGCHLCSVLLDAEWTALASSSKAVLTRRLKDMNIPPNFFLCKIEDGGKNPVRHFVLNASAAPCTKIEKKFTKEDWKLNTVLLVSKEGQF